MKRDERGAAREDHRVERSEEERRRERRGVVDRDLHLHGQMDRPELCDRRHRHEHSEEDGVDRSRSPRNAALAGRAASAVPRTARMKTRRGQRSRDTGYSPMSVYRTCVVTFDFP